MSEENVNTETTSTTEANTTAPEVEGTQVETTPTTEENSTVETKPEAKPELTIESYGDFGLSENAPKEMEYSLDHEKGFKELALKHSISPEAAKEIASYFFNHEKKEYDDMIKTQKEWEQKSAEKYGDNLKNVETNVARVLAEYDKSGEFAKLLNLAGAAKHPATLAFLKSLGEQVLEKPSINANATISAKTSLADYYRSNDEEQY